MSSNVFISYRRSGPASLALRVEGELRELWRGRGEVYLDERVVSGRDAVATLLVDNSLNVSDAMLVIVDECWLQPKMLQQLEEDELRLKAGDPNKDWVYFEIRHALEHDVLLVLVVAPGCLTRWRSSCLPLGLKSLQDGAHPLCCVEADVPLDAQVQLLASLLEERLRNCRRRPSALRAGDSNNRPRPVAAREAEHSLGYLPWSYRLLRWADEVNVVVQTMFWITCALSVFAWLESSAAWVPTAIGAVVLGGAWRLAPMARADYLQRLVTRVTRTRTLPDH